VTFDQIYPGEQRERSCLHWTPLDVAQRACALLASEPAARVLDIGAGVGKLCR
jgi:2-polyprenyl-3-methyl-5-hydroxy-6-metoxy-1,4-benzoquinol methylase